MAYEFETVDDLPAGGRVDHTPLTETIEAYKKAVEAGNVKPGQWTVLKTGDNKESLAATTSTLKDKHGPPSVSGLSFAHRPYHRDSSKRAIYVTYEPHRITEGEAAKYHTARTAKMKEQNDKAKVRKAEKMAAERKAKGNGVKSPAPSAGSPPIQKAG